MSTSENEPRGHIRLVPAIVITIVVLTAIFTGFPLVYGWLMRDF